MTDRRDRMLMRWLQGELDSDQRVDLERELERDPALRQRLERWQEIWLALPDRPPPEMPAGLETRILARLAPPEPSLLATSLGRLAAAAALAGGLLLGVWVGGVEREESVWTIEASGASSEGAVAAGFQFGLTESLWPDYADAAVSGEDGPR